MDILGLIEVPTWLLLTLLIILTLYWYGTRNYNFFKEQGIPGPRNFPFIGSFLALNKHDLYTIDIEFIKQYGKVIGIFIGTAPELMIADEDMINEITVKQFNNFTDHRIFLKEPVLMSNLINLEGDRWRSVRAQMSPTFTTGKLRKMSKEINRCAKSFADRLITTEKSFEAKRCAEAYTMDCIASTAFGLRVDSQKEEENEFTSYGRDLTDTGFRNFRVLAVLFFPDFLIKALNFLGADISIFKLKTLNYFANVVNQVFEGRAKSDEARVDFLQLMMKAYHGEDIQDKDGGEEEAPDKSHTAGKKGMTKDEIVANSLLFLMAGFDTVSIALTQLMYLLACNQDCQDKLLQEIDSVIGEEEEATYELVMKMPYLDQCINETIRIYPPGFRLDRKAVRDTEVCGVKIKKGMIINIMALAIHHDPDIWPEPKKFDPERFAPERKADIKPAHFMPFGLGPRNCIGMRQALFEIKAAIVQILKTHKVVTTEQTEIPLKMSIDKIMKSEKGVWIAVEKRK